MVVAASVAVGASAGVGLAGSISVVSAENRTATKVRSFIDGSASSGIIANDILLTASDNSHIQVDSVGASVAVGAGGAGGGALSIGVTVAF